MINQIDRLDSESSDSDATQESEFFVDWRAQNHGLACGAGSSGASSSPGEVAHVPLFPILGVRSIKTPLPLNLLIAWTPTLPLLSYS